MRVATVTLLAVALSHAAAGQNYIANTYAGGVLIDGTPGLQARLGVGWAIAVDQSGNVFFADYDYNLVLRLDRDGILHRVAGTGAGFTGNGGKPYAGDGGPATGGELAMPDGVAVDANGNVYIADLEHESIRKVSNGIITTAYENYNAPPPGLHIGGLAVDAAGNLYYEDSALNQIFKVTDGAASPVAGNGTYGFSGDGGPATGAQLAFNGANGIAVDAQGNLYIADPQNLRVRKVSNGTITTFAGGGSGGDGGPATEAQFSYPVGVALDRTGTVYIADGGFIRKVTNGVINTIAGGGTNADDGPVASAQIGPACIAVDAAGTVYFFDYSRRLRKIANGTITTLAGIGPPPDPQTAIGALMAPWGVAADPSGSLYIGEGSRIRKVSHGMIFTVAGAGAGVAVAADGSLYIANYSRVDKVTNGVVSTVAGGDIIGYSGDGGPATNARLNAANSVAIGPSGDLYIGDSGNFCVRKVSGGIITTVAGTGINGDAGDGGPATNAQLEGVGGVAVNAAGDLYIADSGRVRKVANGIITTVAGRSNESGFSGDGGPATSALLIGPAAVALDAAGNLYIAAGNRIRKVANGVITTIAGNGSVGPAGDGGPALQAELNQPVALAVDADGNIYVSDIGDNRVVVLTPTTAQNIPLVGAVTSAADGYVATIQVNCWVSIYGSNLAPPTSARLWQGQDFVRGELPVSLDGVSATIGGKAALIEYVSPTQINLLAPDDVPAGSAAVLVTNNGLTSAAFAAQIQTSAPAFFQFGGSNQKYIAAIFAVSDTGRTEYVAPADAFGSGNSRPAKAGDILELYGTGFGPTDPKAPVGQIFFGAYQTAKPVTLTIGGIDAQVSFAGISAAGLYQLNVNVPAGLPDGDAPVVATVLGTHTQDGIFIPVHQ